MQKSKKKCIKGQTKVNSMWESATNILVGFSLAYASQLWVFTYFDTGITAGQTTLVTLWFTVLSLVRSYVIRRFFNKRTHLEKEKGVKMKTAYEGRTGLKISTCLYETNKMKIINKIYEIGKIKIFKVVYPKRDENGWIYKNEVLEELAEFYNIKGRYTYSKVDGGYVGHIEFGYRLYQKGLTEIQKINDNTANCSIGWNDKEQKWYGWSHRAMYGFKIGDIVKEGDCTASSGWTENHLREHPEDDISLSVGFTAKTLEDCKLMAVAFAESVG